jgi:hypothetical protein
VPPEVDLKINAAQEECSPCGLASSPANTVEMQQSKFEVVDYSEYTTDAYQSVDGILAQKMDDNNV